MKYSKIIIYYFSGTGNSKNVALWLAETAKGSNLESEVINIIDLKHSSIPEPSEDALLIFVSPIHGFNYPPVMLNFIRKFPIGDNNIVLMNTRAGMKIGKIVTPGLTGIAFYFSALIFKLKGYSISGMMGVDLPSNWISLHPGLNKNTIEFLHAACKVKVAKFAQRIFSGEKVFKIFWDMIPDILVSPIAIGYFFIGRFILSKTYFASADCNKCGICQKNCPVEAIKNVADRPFWTLNCESCMKCMGNCPTKAIETAHGFLLSLLIIDSVIIGFIYKYFYTPFIAINSELIFTIFESAIFLILLTIGYRFLHYLLKFKSFERIVTYTSLTKYKFWGRRYKAMSGKDSAKC